ncbi:MAG: AEC family transporter [Lachnospiraceae bacterium]|nr:AEC family transporter [Lachnospiraceae bacterium]
MSFTIILGQMLMIMAMVMVGYLVKKLGWITNEVYGGISKLVINILNPFMLISAAMEADRLTGHELTENMLYVGLFYALSIFVSIGLAFIIVPKGEYRTLYVLMGAFPNTGFIGIPVIRGIYGKEAVVYIAFYMVIYSILLYSLAIWLSKRSAAIRGTLKESEKYAKGFLKQMIVNPGMAASVIAIFLVMTDIKFPQQVVTVCDYFGDATIPLSMIMIGCSLVGTKFKEFVGDIRLYVFMILHMLVMPVIVALATRGLGSNEVIRGVFLIELAMPIGTVVGIMAGEYGADGHYAMKGTMLSTIVCLVTLPIVGLFF